jgi:RNA polymerase-binding transcription factor DksA
MVKIRARLIKKRDEVFDAHRLSDETRFTLADHDIESEETAQKEVILSVLATLDEQAQKELQAIRWALARLELGEYGLCEVCGRKIEVKRLEAIPWTSVCKQHAGTK